MTPILVEWRYETDEPRWLLSMEIIQEECFRPNHVFVSRSLRPNAKSELKFLTVPSTKTISPLASTIFSIHDIIHFDAKAAKQIRGCAAIFILVIVCRNLAFITLPMLMKEISLLVHIAFLKCENSWMFVFDKSTIKCVLSNFSIWVVDIRPIVLVCIYFRAHARAHALHARAQSYPLKLPRTSLSFSLLKNAHGISRQYTIPKKPSNFGLVKFLSLVRLIKSSWWVMKAIYDHVKLINQKDVNQNEICHATSKSFHSSSV